MGKQRGKTMEIDANIPPCPLGDVPGIASQAEALGFGTLWSSETQHDPFLPLGLVAEHSEHMHFGTAIAVGFARGPGTLAYTAWDLAQYSGGRFILGLGTQVRPHIERRFGMPWPASPVGKLRELIQAIRAYWVAWQSGEPLSFHGEYFRLNLMTPFFNPGPIEHPEIPIYIAGVNKGLCRLAGEAADGLIAHPYHSERYLREVVLPSIAEGAERVGRQADQIQLFVTALTIVEPGDEDFVRQQVAFYASTPTYRPVMALHGWGEIADQLRDLSRQQAWGGMTDLVTDEMLNTFAIQASPDALASALEERYKDLADRLALYMPFYPGQRDAFWRNLVGRMRSSS
jgi:probable F420-dependent oxidoreductase